MTPDGSITVMPLTVWSGSTGVHQDVCHWRLVRQCLPAGMALHWQQRTGRKLSVAQAAGGTQLVEHAPRRHGATSRAFTLVEMVIVVAVILVLVGLVLPAATALWNQRREAEAQNTISGMLITARARAIQADRGEAGLFLFIDERGVQRIAPIARDPNDPTAPSGEGIRTWQTDPQWRNVFTVGSDRAYALPPPMRAAPRYAVEDETNRSGAPATQLFSDVELANEDFLSVPAGGDQAQRHRNFFTLVFSGDGTLLLRRDVLIRDVDADGDLRGDLTGLGVGPAEAVRRYYPQDAAAAVDIVPGLASPGIDSLVVDGERVALNFPSVDGLLVYDDSLFREAGSPPEKRAYLLNTAQPFYVHRLTGAVVRGPTGENAAPSP